MNRIFRNTCLILLVVLILPGCGRKNGSDQQNEAANNQSQSKGYYTCPMHPSVRSDHPGVCPICHMTLVKVTAGESTTVHDSEAESVHLSPARQVLANVSTFEVVSRQLEKEVPLAGKIDYAEPNAQQVTARFGGRIEQLSVSYVGQHVGRDEAVAEIYSPEAMTAQQEFLLALGQSTSSDTSQNPGSNLVQQTRLKLRLWGFTDDQLDELARTKSVKTVVTIHSPISGTIIRKNVDLQQYVTAGDPLFDVADLNSVWLLLDLYETDLSSVQIAQKVIATVDAYPTETFGGTISFIGAVVEPSTRTVRVRATLQNPGLRLKPDMFANAMVLVPLAKSLVVPASAVIQSGRRTAVWVEVSPEHFEPRAVTLGQKAGDFYQILDGLHAGDVVAVSGNYLIDSESQLQMAAKGNQAQ
jgi:membrane fusion protein, copper/silver efflux system